MFHLMAEVNFPMGKAHVTDVIVTTKYWQQSACHSILRELKITHKKKNTKRIYRICRLHVCSAVGVRSSVKQYRYVLTEAELCKKGPLLYTSSKLHTLN